MKTILVSIGLCLAVVEAHSMPFSPLNANGTQPVIRVADQCGDRCESLRSHYSPYRRAFRGDHYGRYVLVRDPLVQRHPFCPLGTYVACIGSGMFCVDLCY